MLVVATGATGAFLTLPRPDTTWLLYVTGQLLDGATLGVDVVENSPPVILWLKVPVVLLARATGRDPWLLWIAAVSLLGVVSLVACGRILRRVPSLAGSADVLVGVLAVGLFLLPLQDFGQREHVAAALALPWLLAVAARAEGAPLGTRQAMALALAAGLGLAIKPHFGLVWLAVVGALLRRENSARALVTPEVMATALVPAMAIVATSLLHPDWLVYARLNGPLYQRFGYENPLWVGLVGEGIEWSWLGILALLAFAPAIRPWRGSLSVLAGGLAGFHLSAALQFKGWGYHSMPAGMVGLLVAAAAATCAAWSGDRLVRRIYRLAVPLGIAVVAGGGVRRTAGLAARPDTKWGEADPSLRALATEIRRSGHEETLLLLSTNIGAGFPLAHLARAQWTMRHPSLWTLGAIYVEELRDSGLVELRRPASWKPEEQRIVRELEEDVARRPPTLVIVPDPMPDAPIWAASQRFRYGMYFGAVEGLRTAACLDAEPARVGAYLVRRCR